MKLTYLFIAFLIGALACFFIMKPKPIKTEIIKTDTIYNLDTVRFVLSNTKFVFNDTGSFHVKNDTLRIKRDSLIYLNTKQMFERVVVDDSNLFVNIKDTIFNNMPIGTSGSYVIKKAVSYTILKPVEKVNKFYVGGILGVIKDRSVFAPGLIWQTKKDLLIGANYDLLNKGLLINVGYKIR